MYAIISVGGKQYKVQKGDIIDVTGIEGNEGSNIKLNDILLSDNGKSIFVGEPVVKNKSVVAKVLGNVKGEKVHVRRFKSKVRYRRNTGFRASLTRLQILSIE